MSQHPPNAPAPPSKPPNAPKPQPTSPGPGRAMSRVPLDLAEYASKVPLRTLRRWCEQGRLTVEVVGGAYLVDLAEVAELAEQRAEGSGRLTRSG